MPSVDLYNIEGKKVGDIDLKDEIFGVEVNQDVLHTVVLNQLANKRQGTQSTKTKSEVRGGGAKPWRQKGTGRARAGHKRSPLWVGGGIVFGPKPRDYSYKLPKKVKRLAIKSILSKKVKEEGLKVVEDFTVESGKTKDLVNLLKNIVKEERTVVVLKDNDPMVKRAGRNIPWISFLSYNRLRAHDLFYGKNVVVLESAVKNLNDFYA